MTPFTRLNPAGKNIIGQHQNQHQYTTGLGGDQSLARPAYVVFWCWSMLLSQAGRFISGWGLGEYIYVHRYVIKVKWNIHKTQDKNIYIFILCFVNISFDLSQKNKWNASTSQYPWLVLSRPISCFDLMLLFWKEATGSSWCSAEHESSSYHS